mgnify:CR=1 FL=1
MPEMISELGSQFGTVLSDRLCKDIRLRVVSYTPDSRTPRHEHARSYFAFVIHGNYVDSRSRSLFACDEGTVKFHRAGNPHECCFGPQRVRQFLIELPLETPLFDHANLPKSQSPIAGAARDIVRRIYSEAQSGTACDLMLQGLFLQLLSVYTSQSVADQSSQWLQRLRQLLIDECHQPWELTALAAEFQKHPVHIAQSFRTAFGETIGEFRRRARIARGRRLLSETEMPLVQIAEQLGFADQSHFTRVFRQVVGIPPGQYRLQRRC